MLKAVVDDNKSRNTLTSIHLTAACLLSFVVFLWFDVFAIICGLSLVWLIFASGTCVLELITIQLKYSIASRFSLGMIMRWLLQGLD